MGEEQKSATVSDLREPWEGLGQGKETVKLFQMRAYVGKLMSDPAVCSVSFVQRKKTFNIVVGTKAKKQMFKKGMANQN